MSNRRVKGIAYDEDDFDDYNDDDYEQDEEMSPEDQEQMNQGRVKVREALGDVYNVPDRAIEDALWNYYYDISKTVSYLKNEFKPVQPKQQKQPSRFDQAAAAVKTPQSKKSGQLDYAMFPLPEKDNTYNKHFSAADFFKDTPWLNVPPNLKAEIIIEPLFPRGGLLGGSSGGSKPSKLAQLAAARKKKEEEKKAQGRDSQSSQSSSNALSLLSQLGNRPNASERVKGNRSSPESGQKPDENVPPSAEKSQQGTQQAKTIPKSTPKSIPDTKQPESEVESREISQETLKARPSPFALTVTGFCSAPNQPFSTQRPEPTPLFPIPGHEYDHLAETNRAFLGPSPDDVVEQAQAKGKKGNSSEKNSKTSDDSTGGPVQAISDLSVQDVPKVKSKNLDVVSEFKKSSMKSTASFVVVGHVDHGKSTLMGRLLLDLKVVDQRTIDKLRKEAETIGKSSFALAWVMDQTSDERSRGVTVDIATNNFETEKTRFTILDAPGHRDFIPNMIAGASQADFAIMVIDAGTDSFESGLKGQTKEHALLVRAIGVQRVIVAVNKMDAVSWSQSRFDEIQQQMSAFFTSAGFPAAAIAFVPCAGLTGDNIVARVANATAPWYSGATLVEELDAAKPSERSLEKPLRMSIADIFRGGVTNPLSITGRIEAGTLQVGDQILVQPAGETASIKGIEVDGEAADWAVAGILPVLHLTDIDPVHLRLGDVVCSPTNSPIRNVRAFEAKILAFDHVMPQQVDVHKGRMHVPGKVSELLAILDAKTGQPTKDKKKKPRVVQPGAMAKVRVELEKALPLEVSGRVVLRAEGSTIAAGLLDAVIS